MSKRLVIYPKFKFITVLHDAQSISPYVPREQECRFVPSLISKQRDLLRVIEYGLAVLEDLLFTGKDARKHFYSVVFVFEFESPNVLFLCAEAVK